MLTVRCTPATSTIASRLRLVDDLHDPARNGQAHRRLPSAGVATQPRASGLLLGRRLRKRLDRRWSTDIWNASSRASGRRSTGTCCGTPPTTRLCEAIVDGTLAPGEVLHDDELCAWLGLSRTPVRDALRRLRDEGLVEMAPQRFTRVASLTRARRPRGRPAARGRARPGDRARRAAAGRGRRRARCARTTTAFVAALRARDGARGLPRRRALPRRVRRRVRQPGDRARARPADAAAAPGRVPAATRALPGQPLGRAARGAHRARRDRRRARARRRPRARTG